MDALKGVMSNSGIIIGRCDTCGATFTHILRDGIECGYISCSGHLHFDSAAVRMYVEQLHEARARVAELEALLTAEQATAEAAGDAALQPPHVAPDWQWRAGQG